MTSSSLAARATLAGLLFACLPASAQSFDQTPILRGARGALEQEVSRKDAFLPLAKLSPRAGSPAAAVEPRAYVDLADPELTSDELTYVRREGPLFVRGEGDPHKAAANDIAQGQLGDCYFLSSLAAVAACQPGVIEGMFTENDDGTVTVRLFELPFEGIRFLGNAIGFDIGGGQSRFRDVVVDRDLPSDDGEAAYARGVDVDEHGQAELWVMLAEKAYAVLKGGYDDIGSGGLPGLALNAITGAGSKRYTLPLRRTRTITERLTRALRNGQPVTLCSTIRLFRPKVRLHKGVVQRHVYAVLGINARGYLNIYNPWGHTHPRPMKPSELKKAFIGMDLGR